jgi:hypothetical protein
MANNFKKIASAKTSASALPKSTLKKGKLQPFGAHYVTRLSSVNSKLVCSLSRIGDSDIISDNCDACQEY